MHQKHPLVWSPGGLSHWDIALSTGVDVFDCAAVHLGVPHQFGTLETRSGYYWQKLALNCVSTLVQINWKEWKKVNNWSWSKEKIIAVQKCLIVCVFEEHFWKIGLSNHAFGFGADELFVQLKFQTERTGILGCGTSSLHTNWTAFRLVIHLRVLRDYGRINLCLCIRMADSCSSPWLIRWTGSGWCRCNGWI